MKSWAGAKSPRFESRDKKVLFVAGWLFVLGKGEMDQRFCCTRGGGEWTPELRKIVEQMYLEHFSGF
jgi:hypothetical protein